MVNLKYFSVLFAVPSLLVDNAFCHPGEHHDDISAQVLRRDLHAKSARRSLSECAKNPQYLELSLRSATRREAKANALRKRASLPTTATFSKKVRDLAALEEFEETSHNSSLTGLTTSSDPSLLFTSNGSCILTPEITQGPYFIDGEYIRSNITETQAGVPIHLEMQFINVNTCQPVEGLYIDGWHANATGVYSGVAVSGNGVGTADPANINTTFLRGLQPTDSSGVAAFDSIFPGHYTGRATHFHIIAHNNGTVLSNKTYSGGGITHVGQIFFDESLRAAVEEVEPYVSNTQTPTTNDEDMWAPDQAENGYDPLAEYVYLGDDVSDGLLLWISVGVDLSVDYEDDLEIAGTLTANGGVANSNSLTGGSGGGDGSGEGPGGSSGGNGTGPGFSTNGTATGSGGFGGINGTNATNSSSTSSAGNSSSTSYTSGATDSITVFRSAAIVMLLAMWLTPLLYIF